MRTPFSKLVRSSRYSHLFILTAIFFVLAAWGCSLPTAGTLPVCVKRLPEPCETATRRQIADPSFDTDRGTLGEGSHGGSQKGGQRRIGRLAKTVQFVSAAPAADAAITIAVGNPPILSLFFYAVEVGFARRPYSLARHPMGGCRTRVWLDGPVLLLGGPEAGWLSCVRPSWILDEEVDVNRRRLVCAANVKGHPREGGDGLP